MSATPSRAINSSRYMDYEQDQPEASPAQGICATLLANPPWNAKSVVAAGVATVGGLASWVAGFSSPAVVGIGGSYLGAEGLNHILFGYLPSTGAGAVVVFFGFRNK